MVRWLRLHSPIAGGPSWIPDHGTRSHMPQIRVHVATKDPAQGQQRSKMPPLRPSAGK